MSVVTSVLCGFPAELSGSMTGSAVAIGTLLFAPDIVIFDNQGTVNVAISFDGGTTTWKTFQGGEALVLDLRANKGDAFKFSIPVGTIITGTGASGTFRVSYVYSKKAP